MQKRFWSGLQFCPAIYGADNPTSLFEDKLEYGWNLRHLNCMFAECNVPSICGVTSPMTYFGMWKVQLSLAREKAQQVLALWIMVPLSH